MAASRSRSRKGKRGTARGQKRKAPGSSRLRRVLALLSCLSAAAAVLLLWLYVDVTRGFERRLWRTPSRVYSATLELAAGAAVDAAGLERRLERSGYAEVPVGALRPGQYAHAPEGLRLHRQRFAVGPEPLEPTLLEIRFAGGQVDQVRDGRGNRLVRASLEPELIATLYGPRQEERVVLPLERIPAGFIDAVLSAEDTRFYGHHGLDLRGILRAALTNARHRRIVQGGSTITQQTVKNIFLGQERTWGRKIREAVTSLMLDARYSKERILEVYLNEVYLGQRGAVAVCGAQAAARFYFGRDLDQLTVGEWATLAGMIRSPGRYNPFRHPERASARRDQVLDAMERLGRLGEGEARAARSEPLRLASGGGGYEGGGYAVNAVRRELVARLGEGILDREGVSVFTTLDTLWLDRAERAMSKGLDRLERDVPTVREQQAHRRLQGAVVVADSRTGALRALVGGRDYAESQFNRAIQARRQPGSCFKPVVYVAGFEQGLDGDSAGLTPATLLDDSPFALLTSGNTWQPMNYDREYRGPVTVRRAVEESLNVPTVRASRRVGLERIVATGHAMGIESELTPVPSLALGTSEVTPLEMATVYGTLARGGVRVEPWVVRHVVNEDGTSQELEPPIPVRAVRAESAWMMSEVLAGVLRRGTGKTASRWGFSGEAAGKTGTTDDTRDAWFAGYNRELTVLTWVGYDDNARTGLTGASGALPIWADLMRRTTPAADTTVRPPEPPGDLVAVEICRDSGGRVVRGCETVVRESFAPGSEPGKCRLHEGKLKRWFRKLVGQGDKPRGPSGS